MNKKETYEAVIEQIETINPELANKLKFLRPYYIYQNIPAKRETVKTYVEKTAIKGKSQQTYYDNFPKGDSITQHYLDIAKYNLEFIKDLSESEAFRAEYERQTQKLARFQNHAKNLTLDEIIMGCEGFSLDIARMCAKSAVPYLENPRYASEAYRTYLKRAIMEIKQNEYENPDPQAESMHKQRK